MSEHVNPERDNNDARAVKANLNFRLSPMDAEQCEILVRGGHATLRLPSRILLALLAERDA